MLPACPHRAPSDVIVSIATSSVRSVPARQPPQWRRSCRSHRARRLRPRAKSGTSALRKPAGTCGSEAPHQGHLDSRHSRGARDIGMSSMGSNSLDREAFGYRSGRERRSPLTALRWEMNQPARDRRRPMRKRARFVAKRAPATHRGCVPAADDARRGRLRPGGARSQRRCDGADAGRTDAARAPSRDTADGMVGARPAVAGCPSITNARLVAIWGRFSSHARPFAHTA